MRSNAAFPESPRYETILKEPFLLMMSLSGVNQTFGLTDSIFKFFNMMMDTDILNEEIFGRILKTRPKEISGKGYSYFITEKGIPTGNSDN